MLLPIRPICNRKKIRKDGTSLIQIQYCFSAEKKHSLVQGSLSHQMSGQRKVYVFQTSSPPLLDRLMRLILN
jgi:hypothetical protein